MKASNIISTFYEHSGFFYLAGPYSHPDQTVRATRAQAYSRLTSALQTLGFSVHSPISQGHQVAVYLPSHLAHSHDFWMTQDLPILKAAAGVIVALFDGWEVSKGLATEMAEVAKGKPCRVVPEPGAPANWFANFREHFQIADAADVQPWPSTADLLALANLPEVA